MRVLFLAASIHLPFFLRKFIPEKMLTNELHQMIEISKYFNCSIFYHIKILIAVIRQFEAFSFGILQPFICLILMPNYRMKIKEFFNLNDRKRNWQSAGQNKK